MAMRKERSQIRSPIVLSRLCLVLAIATLYKTQQVVASGLCRQADCHGQRGSSYLFP
ncbi:hypothetical protein [Nostoc sp. NMS9]|uniref:hypothetical protein n=1 Tax=Nostoc sp. NMS9 TaxID=2815393 RepID=UPI0025EC54E4|nr:hypothetical protein [Nostoc sp. NMS9]MBN3944526.1 hypothetical protein [Nostoc sp. NMS9]